MNKILKQSIMWFVVILIFLIIIYTRFTNIDMSEMRILITFWKRWLCVLGLGIFMLWFGSKDD